MGALVAGNDIRYPMPGSHHHPLAGTFAPDLTLHTDQGMVKDCVKSCTARGSRPWPPSGISGAGG
jgi:hypothetical protein